MYVWRSLKRGYSTKDLGISAFKAQRIKFKEQYNEFKDKFQKEHFGKTFDEGYEKIRNKVSDIVKKNEVLIFLYRLTKWNLSQKILFITS